MNDFFIPLVAFAFGACAGSFLNVCVYRWPHDKSVVRPRSRCPRCKNPLAWFENIPIVSWLVLRGKCRCCDEPISFQYPLVELVVALAWFAFFRAWADPFVAFRVSVMATILFGVAITDARHYVIPDGFTVFGMIFAMVTSVVALMQDVPTPFATPYGALIGACTGAGFIAIAGWLGEVVTKREAMGMGDVTLMAFAGAALGPERAIITVFVAAFIGIIVFLGVVYPVARVRASRGSEQTELALGNPDPVEMPLVPFGVFLAPAAMVTLLWGESMVQWLVNR
ncbi:MAG: pilD [Gemmatimonadetes bacterium]|nr:pilD [Gemmatimonadota bacterium]